MELEPNASRPVIERLERARAHLAEVIAMMERGSDCEDLVTELAVVDKAIAGGAYALVATGLHQRLVAGPDTGGDEDDHRMERLFLGFA